MFPSHLVILKILNKNRIFHRFPNCFLRSPLNISPPVWLPYERGHPGLSFGTGGKPIAQLVGPGGSMKDGYKDTNKIFLHRNSESIVGPPYQSGSHSSSLYGRAGIGLSIGTGCKTIEKRGGKKRAKFGKNI